MAYVDQIEVDGVVNELQDSTARQQIEELSEVAHSGDYNDLLNRPDLSGFITRSVNDLVNYYTKTETYTKTEVNNLVNAIKQFTYEVVATLPTASASTMYKIYLVPATTTETQNIKDEYITIQSGSTYSWEQIGSTAVDLSGYSTTEQMNAAIANALTNYYTKTEVDGKIDESDAIIPADVTRTQTDATFVNNNNVPLFYLRQANSSLAGLMTAAGYTKLNDMPAAQEVNAGLAYDVSVLHPTSGVNGGSTYASLSAALAVIPQSKRKGGMTVKFVQSSDNKYVQYRLMRPLDNASTAAADFMNEANWQGVDSEPTPGSHNLVESNGAADATNFNTSVISNLECSIASSYFVNKSFPTSLVAGKAYKLSIATEGFESTDKWASYNAVILYDSSNNTTAIDGLLGIPNGSAIENNKEYSCVIIPPVNFTKIGIVCKNTYVISASKIFTVNTVDYVSVKDRVVALEALVGEIEKSCYNKIPFTAEEGAINSSTGQPNTSTSRMRTEYIDVSGIEHLLYAKAYTSSTSRTYFGLAFYDSTKTFIPNSGIEESNSRPNIGYDIHVAAVPQDAKYVRFTYWKDKIAGLFFFCDADKDGIARAYFDMVNTANELGQSVEDLYGKNKEKADINPGKNLYNPATNTPGKYFANASGLIGDAPAYSITDFIAVIPGDNLYISPKTNESAASASAYLIFYKLDKTYDSGVVMNTRQFVVPQTAAYMRFSVVNARQEVQAEIGTERTTYEPYNPIGGYPVIIPDNSITWENLTEAVQDRITRTIIEFKGFSVSGSLEPAEFIKTPEVYLEKDAVLSCLIDGTLNHVLCGVGKTATGFTYFAHWLDIDTTEVKLYWYNNSTNVLLNTYQHGLTLTDKTTIVVETKIEQNTKVTKLRMFNDHGDVFEQNLTNWGVGAAFVANANSSGDIDCSLQLFPRQITKKIWLFGDSYVLFNNNTRWPYYFAQSNMLDYFSNNQPGLGPDAAYTALTNLLTLGYTPSYVVWTLGMNGSVSETQSGGQYVINASQKAVIDNVVTLCDTYGIIPIFGIVPTVPTRQKTGFGNYIKSLGFGVIDFADAVGADEYGIWHGAPTLNAYTDSEDNTIYVQVYGDGHVLATGDHTFDVNGDKLSYDISSVGIDSITVNSVTYTRNSSLDVTGLLSTDGVHPSTLGAKVLASRVFVDFPELTIIE